MARVTVEDALKKEPNRFSLVMLAAKRAKQILEGSKVVVDGLKNKAVVSALREIAEGRVRFMTDEDMKIARERERKARQEALARAAKAQEEKEKLIKAQIEAGLAASLPPEGLSDLDLIDDDDEDDETEEGEEKLADDDDADGDAEDGVEGDDDDASEEEGSKGGPEDKSF